MSTVLKSDGKQIIDSGTVLTYASDSNLEIIVDKNEDDYAIKIILEFDSDNENSKPYLRFETKQQEKTIVIKCLNFTNTLGSGTSKVLELATINEKKLFMNFIIRRLNDGIREVVYTLYEG